MTIRTYGSLALVGALTMSASLASAQVPARPRNFGRPNTPPISRNLLLLNNNNSFEYNYLGTLGMERQMNQMNQRYNNELDTLERDFYQNRLPTPRSTIGPQGTSRTGHGTGFFNYGNYYRLGGR